MVVVHAVNGCLCVVNSTRPGATDDNFVFVLVLVIGNVVPPLPSPSVRSGKRDRSLELFHWRWPVSNSTLLPVLRVRCVAGPMAFDIDDIVADVATVSGDTTI